MKNADSTLGTTPNPVKFGRLTVLREVRECKYPGRKYDVMVECVCDCGTLRTIYRPSLRRGLTKSCGCLRNEIVSKITSVTSLVHGHCVKGKDTPEYRVWNGMMKRCFNKKDKSFKNYGGRGIKVCRVWKTFINFYRDMGSKPHGHSIDRVDNNGDYEPGNCRWATIIQQSRNRRSNTLVDFNGVKMCLAEVAEISGISSDQLYLRLRRGWNLERAAKTPIGPYPKRIKS